MPSKLEQLQLQFRQRLLQEKEERLIKIHTDNQQKALSKVARYTTTTTTKSITPPQSHHHSPIKKGSPGVDRSRPLPPIAKPEPLVAMKYNSMQNTEANGYNKEARYRTSEVNNDIEEPRNGSQFTFPKTLDQPVASRIVRSGFSRSQTQDQLDGSRLVQSSFNRSHTQDQIDGLRISQSGFGRTQTQDQTDAPRLAFSRSQDQQKYSRTYQSDTSNKPGIQQQCSRTSQVDIGSKVEPNNRSKSVELDQKSTVSRTNGQRVPSATRNGGSRSAASEGKPDSTRAKQAETQRMKTMSKPQTESAPRNGYNGRTAKSPTDLRKTVKAVSPVAAAARPKPKPPVPSSRSPPPAKAPSRAPAKPSRAGAGASASAPRKPPGPGQAQCPVCGRNFNSDRLEKHEQVCRKAAAKKVKVFDATKMRTKGTEAEQFVRKGVHKAEPKQVKKADWRKKRNEFIEAIRQAKLVQQHLARGGKVSDLPPPPPSDTSDYVSCPHCNRRFSEAVADRHIPKCKNILSNKKNPNAPPPRRK